MDEQGPLVRVMRVAVLTTMLTAASPQASGFEVGSPTYGVGDGIPALHQLKGFGCEGDNVSPALHWKGAPVGTKYFAVTLFDPDAPTGSGWWHWVVFNIPAMAEGLEQGASLRGNLMPRGAIESATDFGTSGYGGPCPPAGDPPHRYVLTVWALPDRLRLSHHVTPAMVGFHLHRSALARAQIVATHGR